MPRTTRQIIADKLESSKGHLTSVQNYMAQIAELVQDQRPDIAAEAMIIKELVEEFKTAIIDKFEELF